MRRSYNPLAAKAALRPLIATLSDLRERLPDGPLVDDIDDALSSADDQPRMEVLKLMAEVALGLRPRTEPVDVFERAARARSARRTW